MKLFNGFFIVLFIIFAALQYNDPDPYIWVPIYLYAAFLCWQSLRNIFRPALFMIGFVLYGVYAIYKILDHNGVLDWITRHHAQNIAETMKAETPWVEEAREFFGLIIVIIVLLIDYIYMKKRVKPLPLR